MLSLILRPSMMIHRSLKIRFRGALVGALLNMPNQAVEGQPRGNIPYLFTNFLNCSNPAPAPDTELVVNNETDEILKVVTLGLYWHQDLDILANYFTALEQLILAVAIAFACRDALNPRTLIADLCFWLQQQFDVTQKPELPNLLNSLRLAQNLVDQGASGAIAQTKLLEKLPERSLALAFYYFLSTPSEYELATQRAAKAHPHLGMIVGAIAGAYLGYIPLEKVELEIVKTTKKESDRLLAACIGVYDLNCINFKFYPTVTIPNALVVLNK